MNNVKQIVYVLSMFCLSLVHFFKNVFLKELQNVLKTIDNYNITLLFNCFLWLHIFGLSCLWILKSVIHFMCFCLFGLGFLWWKAKDLARNIVMLGYSDKVFDSMKISFENCRKSCLKFLLLHSIKIIFLLSFLQYQNNVFD